jgi:phage FluMu protein Com
VRLFDSKYGCVELTGPTPDLAIKCPRCSRKEHRTVIVKYRMQLPRWIGHAEPKAVHCVDVNCRARVIDVGLPYVLSENGDAEVACPRCHRLTKISLEGLAFVK